MCPIIMLWSGDPNFDLLAVLLNRIHIYIFANIFLLLFPQGLISFKGDIRIGISDGGELGLAMDCMGLF